LDLSDNRQDRDNLQKVPASVIGELINLEDLNLNHCKKLTTLPHSITQLTKLKRLEMQSCKSLAEPLPDLSHLLPGLEIEHSHSASDAAKAWAKRGCTSLPN
jgi:hypothetical protein